MRNCQPCQVFWPGHPAEGIKHVVCWREEAMSNGAELFLTQETYLHYQLLYACMYLCSCLFRSREREQSQCMSCTAAQTGQIDESTVLECPCEQPTSPSTSVMASILRTFNAIKIRAAAPWWDVLSKRGANRPSICN